jgi:hypothetical protein
VWCGVVWCGVVWCGVVFCVVVLCFFFQICKFWICGILTFLFFSISSIHRKAKVFTEQFGTHKQIDGCYDVIIMSHSLYGVKNKIELLKHALKGRI